MDQFDKIFENLPDRDISKHRDMDPVIGMDLDYQPKWNIPEKIVITCALVGGPIMRAKNPNQL